MTSSSDTISAPAAGWLTELDPANVVRPRSVRRSGATVDAERASAIRDAVARLAAEATQRGFRDGHDAGFDAGHREGVRAARAETQAALAALHAAAVDVEERAATDLADAAQAIATAALDLAEAVIGRHIEAAADPGADAIARALALAPSGRLVVRMHPDDIALLDTSALPPDGRAAVVPDPSIGRGGCIVEGGATTIDAQVGPALERARQAILDAGGAAGGQGARA
jgi:flagellar assembly protein FliH